MVSQVILDVMHSTLKVYIEEMRYVWMMDLVDTHIQGGWITFYMYVFAHSEELYTLDEDLDGGGRCCLSS